MKKSFKTRLTFTILAMLMAASVFLFAACATENGNGPGNGPGNGGGGEVDLNLPAGVPTIRTIPAGQGTFTHRQELGSTMFPDPFNPHIMTGNAHINAHFGLEGASFFVPLPDVGQGTGALHQGGDGFDVAPTNEMFRPEMALSWFDAIEDEEVITNTKLSAFGLERTDTLRAIAINLRPGMRFSNGTLITAQTFVDSYQLLMDPRRLNARAPGDTTSLTQALVGAYEYHNQNAALYSNIQTREINFDTVGIFAHDRYTLVKIYEEPRENEFRVLWNLSSLFLVDPDVYQRLQFWEGPEGTGHLDTHYNRMGHTADFVTAGAYILTSWTDSMMRWERNPYWFGYHVTGTGQALVDQLNREINHFPSINPAMFQADYIENIVVSTVDLRYQMFMRGEIATLSLSGPNLTAFDGTTHFHTELPNSFNPSTRINPNHADLLAIQNDASRIQIASSAASDVPVPSGMTRSNIAPSNIVVLSNEAFRRAFMLSMDLREYTRLHPAGASYGLIGYRDFFDLDNQVTSNYRLSQPGRRAILRARGIITENGVYTDTEVNRRYQAYLIAFGGRQLSAARAYMQQVFGTTANPGGQAASIPGFSAGQDIVIRITLGATTNFMFGPANRHQEQYLNEAINAAAYGTPFYGRIRIFYGYAPPAYDTFDEFEHGNLEAKGFGAAGWTDQLDPFESFRQKVEITSWSLAVPGLGQRSVSIRAHFGAPLTHVNNAQEGDFRTYERTILEWINIFQGRAGDDLPDFSVDNSHYTLKIAVLAEIEHYIMRTGIMIPKRTTGTSFLRWAKVSYPLLPQNAHPMFGAATFRFMNFLHTDASWDSFVDSNLEAGSLREWYERQR